MSARTMQWARAGALAFAAIATLAGCPPCGMSAGETWSFEQPACDGRGALCGFDVVAGNAQLATAFTPGEHALQIANESRVASMVSPSVGTSGGLSGGLGVALLARCDAGTTLEIEETLSETFGGADGGAAVPSLVVTSATLTPGTDWGQGNATLVAPTSAAGTPRSTSIVSLALITHGPGGCTVDDVQLSVRVFLCE